MGYLEGMEKWPNYIIIPNIEEVIKKWNKNKNVNCIDVVNMLRCIYLENWVSKIQTTTLETPNLDLKTLHSLVFIYMISMASKMASRVIWWLVLCPATWYHDSPLESDCKVKTDVKERKRED